MDAETRTRTARELIMGEMEKCMPQKSIKQQIDEKYQEPFIRRLMYWKYGSNPDCWNAMGGDNYCSGTQPFSNDVCELIDYIDTVRKKQDQNTRNACAKAAAQAAQIWVENGGGYHTTIIDSVHMACINVQVVK